MQCRQSRSVGITKPHSYLVKQKPEDEFKEYNINTLQRHMGKKLLLHIQDPTNEDNEVYNTPIAMAELESTLETKARSAPGEDSITYEIRKQSPKEFKNTTTATAAAAAEEQE